MSARFVTFSSAKGGSGKTVLCASFGWVLSGLGQRVLLVDADADTAGMTLFFLDEVIDAKEAASGPAEGLFELEQGEAPRLVELGPNLYFLPGQYKVDRGDGAPSIDAVKLKLTLSQFRDAFDFVLIDAQAGADTIALEAARVSDEVILVAEYDPVSAQGVKRLEQLKPAIFAPDRTWILYNKVLPELTTSIGSLLRVERHLRPVPWNAEVVRHFVERELAVNMETPNTFTLAVVENLEILFRRRLRAKINQWRHGAAEALRAPIQDQLERVEFELDKLTRRKIEVETEFDFRRRRFRLMLNVLATSAAMATVAFFVILDSKLTFVGPAVLGMAPLLAIMMIESTRFGGRIGTETRVELARLERRYAALEEQRRMLAVTADDALRSIRPEAHTDSRGDSA